MTAKFTLALSTLALAAGAASAQTLGKGGSVATGSAGPGGQSQSATPSSRVRCAEGHARRGRAAGPGRPEPAALRPGLADGVIRMMIQQSNCFQVVERGVGMGNLMQERALAQAASCSPDQNIGKGQMVAADFIVTPSVVFSENNAGGVGGAFGGLLGGRGGAVLGSIAGGLKFKEAQTSMLLVDSRSSIQVAAARRQRAADRFRARRHGWSAASPAPAVGGYTNTNEGKVIAASFMDNWNNIVRAIRNNPSLVQASAGVASQTTRRRA